MKEFGKTRRRIIAKPVIKVFSTDELKRREYMRTWRYEKDGYLKEYMDAYDERVKAEKKPLNL